MNVDLDDIGILRHSAKILVAVSTLLLLTMWNGCTEIRYMISGNTIDANVISAYNGMEGSKRRYPVVNIEYGKGTDAGYQVKGIEFVRPEVWEVIQGKTVNITYIEGKDLLNTLTIKRSKVWVVLLFVMVALAAFFCWGAWEQAKRDVARSKRRG